MLAAIAAGIGGGAWQEPRLLAPGTPGAPAPVVHRLPASLTSALHTAMRAVVTGGTGVTANLPGLPVYGKTGTAEFGNAHPPQTDAWFAAFRGNLALAVVVQGGGFGETAAAPVVARFLAQVPPSMQAGTGPG
jgi:cell division protein FtsI/penicillin-binding protein 2